MSGVDRNLKTQSSVSKTSLRPNSANSRNSNLTIQIQKREKLKSLLIEKFIKKFSRKEYKNLIQTEVSDFITKEKLTEIDLKNFESHLSQLIQQDKNQKELKLNLDNYSNISDLENKKAQKLTDNESKYSKRKENYNINHTDFDKKSTYTVSTLNSRNQNKNNVSKNVNDFQIKTDKDKNSFLKTTANKNSEKIGFEKSNKLIINKNNPTILKNKNNFESINNKNNIKIAYDHELNSINNQKDINIKNNNLEIKNEQKSKRFQITNNSELEEKLSLKENSRPLSVKNLNMKNLKLEKEESGEEESFDFDVEDIKNFELKKLFKDEKKPLERVNFDIESDEWQAIENYKKNLHKNRVEESKRIDKEIKMKNRQAFDKQLKEKAIIKDKNKIQDMYHHEKVMNNVEKMYIDEIKKFKETEEKKIKEKAFREKQIKESMINKKKYYLENLKNDKKILDNIQREIEKEKEIELEKRIIAKENLKKTLEENEEFKKQQIVKSLKEREEDKKAMEEYSKMLEKQEWERAQYFKKCEDKQKAFMNRMKDTVIKNQENELREEELKIKQYQEEKEKKEKDEEEKKILYQKNSKHMIKDFLTQQMEDKKITAEKEKLEEEKQVKIWSKENEEFFKKDKEKNDRIKQLNVMHAEYLKSQMKPKKNYHNDKMNDEEYRLNRDILEEIITLPDNSTRSNLKRNFLI